VYDARPIGTLDFSPHPAPDWVVFFSPSGVKAAQNARGIEWDRVRKAAIGPTTAEALAEAGWTAAAVARAPEPVALAGALRSAAST
jgi:uroporphyrinogen-III synthase